MKTFDRRPDHPARHAAGRTAACRGARLATWLMMAWVVAGCASSAPPFSGQSLASDQLRRDTLAMLRPYNATRTGCERIEAIDASVIREPGNVQTDDRGAVTKGSPARERWVATSCGSQAAYLVDYIPDGTGGNYISIKAETP